MATMDRVIVGVIAAVLIIAGVLITMAAWGSTVLPTWLVSLEDSKIDGILLVIALLLLAAYLISMLLGTIKTDRRSLVLGTALGNIRISAQTIMDLVAKAAREIEGIKNVEVRLHEVEPLEVEISLQLLPDYHIPRLTESLQAEIKDYLQHTVGVDAHVVNVLVKGVLPEPKARLQ